MTNSLGTNTRNILVDFPDWAGGTVYFYLVSQFAASGNEGFPQKEYSLLLDGDGIGTQTLPVPDNTGDASWLWRIETPDNNNYAATLAYGSDLQLTAWLSAVLSTETPNSLLDTFVLKGGDEMTGQLNFSGTDHAGIKLLSLTTAERDALTPAEGMVIYNETDTVVQVYQGAAWVDYGGGGGGTWGTITGTLSDQTDLQAALDAKASTTALGNHEADTTNIHGIADTSALLDTADIGVSVASQGHIHSYQPLDDELTAIAGLVSAADKGIYFTGAGAASLFDLSSFARTILDDANGAAVVATIGAVPASQVTGGGVLATGGFTLTVPATGTAALRSSNTFTGVQLLPDGAVGAPALGFSGETNLGLYKSGTAALGVAILGSNKFNFTHTGGSPILGLANDGRFTWYSGSSASGTTTALLNNVSSLYTAYSFLATTNAVVNLWTLDHQSTGTPASGFGSALALVGKSSTTASQNMARLATLWNVATHASRVADLVAYASYSGGESEIWRGRGGASPAFAVLGATPSARLAHVADPSGGVTIDAEARTVINSILVTLETFGYHATS